MRAIDEAKLRHRVAHAIQRAAKVKGMMPVLGITPQITVHADSDVDTIVAAYQRSLETDGLPVGPYPQNKEGKKLGTAVESYRQQLQAAHEAVCAESLSDVFNIGGVEVTISPHSDLDELLEELLESIDSDGGPVGPCIGEVKPAGAVLRPHAYIDWGAADRYLRDAEQS